LHTLANRFTDSVAFTFIASPALQDNEHIPMVIDLGSHWLDGLGNAGLPGGNPTAALQGIRLTQIVTRQLAPRATHFPPLSTARQVGRLTASSSARLREQPYSS
jgi:hypothetical protein